ncbi:uncharacterized protein [Epargyreus clarus]|uniref:uncharacterized protein n=1 Tax=Epargyreus clarus TaxID=520877 RepID=UPI003C2D3B92
MEGYKYEWGLVTKINRFCWFTEMDRVSCLLILMMATGVLSGPMSGIIGGHDVMKRSIEDKKYKVIAMVEDNVPDIPIKRINQIIDELDRNNLTKFYSNTPDYVFYKFDYEVNNYKNLCRFKSKTWRPSVLEDEIGNRYYALNTNKRIIQELRYETCLPSGLPPHKGEQCQFTENKDGSSAMCRQEYVTQLIYTVEASNKTEFSEIVPRPVRIPSCCSCYLYRSEDLS